MNIGNTDYFKYKLTSFSLSHMRKCLKIVGYGTVQLPCISITVRTQQHTECNDHAVTAQYYKEHFRKNSDTTWFNYIRSLTCFICFILTICKTLRMSVFNKELLTYFYLLKD